MQSLQTVVSDLGAKAAVDSDTARAMDRLPADREVARRGRAD